ncbi:MAG: OsmC family protein [Acidobacteria bacterium]|nr:OsmC family protein [Acidobacteriota bacterium]
MSHHTATIDWHLQGDFASGKYQRTHEWQFDGGARVEASASPSIVPTPLSNPACVDPEEAFIASLASCHMLWFLHLASDDGWIVASYRDQASGTLRRNDAGDLAFTDVTLNPHVTFTGEQPTGQALGDLHHKAHQKCFIANSVKTQIHIQPQG